jgi:sugar phosphate isomerase/epimerase
MCHPDPEQRRTGLRRLRVLATSCSRLGTSKIHLCSGTRDRDNMWRRHPDNDTPEAWRDMSACMREAAEKRTARIEASVADGCGAFHAPTPVNVSNGCGY